MLCFQVEAALTTQPHNDELLTLQKNLQDIVDITLELIAQSKGSIQSEATSSANWHVGDACVALWSEDGEYGNELFASFASVCDCVFTISDSTTQSSKRLLQMATAVFSLKISMLPNLLR